MDQMPETMHTKINAILSDYDGTLSPTDTLRSKTDSIPEQLEGVLWEMSQSIPVCIISSKDYHFLHPRTGFARILSCIMGIETINHRVHHEAPGEIHAKDNHNILLHMINIDTIEEGAKVEGILYLGDSENDNPAFSKASVSVGITSDKRLTPKLDCQYLIEFKNLSEFIRHLAEAEFVFSEDLLTKGK
jgi:trehalose-6-phosphatase